MNLQTIYYWLFKIILNAKDFMGGIFHELAPKHLQVYLDEFCYQFNKGKFKGEWFSRLLSIC